MCGAPSVQTETTIHNLRVYELWEEAREDANTDLVSLVDSNQNNRQEASDRPQAATGFTSGF